MNYLIYLLAMVFLLAMGSCTTVTIVPSFELHINFANLIDEKTVHVRTWERGCGRTLACGTGSCATAVLCHKAGFTQDEVEIRLQEGSLLIRVTDSGIIMTGPAALSFEGETNL